MVRIRNKKNDWALFSCYYPTRPNTKGEETSYLQTPEGITSWSRKETDKLPARTTPIIGIDLHDGFGRIWIPGTGWTNMECDTYGPGAFESEHQAATIFKEFMTIHRMFACSTKDWGGFTYYGPQGQTRTIDYIVGPASILPQIGACATLGRVGRRHQLINSNLPLAIGFFFP